MIAFYHWQDRFATKKVLLVLAFIYPVFPAILLPAILPDPNLTPLDLTIFYSSEDVYVLFSNLGDTLRNRYFWGLLSIDMVYPVYYSAFASLAMAFLVHRLYTNDSRMQHLRLLPFVILFLDVVENTIITLLLSAYPERINILSGLANYITLSKWLSALVVVMILILLAIQLRFRN